MFECICEIFISMKPSPLTEKMNKWYVGLIGGIRALPLDLPGTSHNHARKCRRKLNMVFQEELEKRKKRANSNSSLGGEEDYDDLMSGLMQMEDERGMKLSDDEVVDNIVSLVLGGYESTSSAVLWAAYHLAKSPDVLAKLRDENAAMSQDKNSNFIDRDDISKMKYTAKVVEETIRMANISPMVSRVTRRDDIEYGGYTIPRGWQVVVWLRSIHTDEKYYTDPLTFNPDRWAKPPKAGTNQVFGAGNRTCPGNMLSRLNISIMLHHLSLGYEWELLNPDAEVDYIPSPMPVDGTPMAFRKLSTNT